MNAWTAYSDPREKYFSPVCTIVIIATETPILQGSPGFTPDPWKHDSDPIG